MMNPNEIKLDKYLRIMWQINASDLFITWNLEPSVKVNGTVRKIDDHILDDNDVNELVEETFYGRDDLRQQYYTEWEANFAIERPDTGRFRVSCFWQLGHQGVVFRRIVTEIPTIEQLKIPEVLRQLVMEKRGLVIFVGATGAGKSTTQAAMIGYRNQTTEGHILTVEDPIEYVHQHQRSIITQREVGVDTKSFDAALKSALREAPDVILIGEIRSEETMNYALSFAETGHLCMATLHANNANQAIERIMHLVPESRHQQLLFDLAFNLEGVIAQQLVPTIDGNGRRAAFEILLGTPVVKDTLLKGNLGELKDIMKQSREAGMVTFDQSLFELYSEGVISYDDALKFADSANEVRLKIKLANGTTDDEGGSLKDVSFY